MGNSETAENVVPRPGTGGDRSLGELLLAAVTGSALAPFVQAVATKLGEDVYGKVKDLLTRRTREPVDHSPGEPITLADPERAIVIRFPADLSGADAARLAELSIPERTRGDWVFVRFDPATGTWDATVVPRPPADAIEVTPPGPDGTAR